MIAYRGGPRPDARARGRSGGVVKVAAAWPGAQTMPQVRHGAPSRNAVVQHASARLGWSEFDAAAGKQNAVVGKVPLMHHFIHGTPRSKKEPLRLLQGK